MLINPPRFGLRLITPPTVEPVTLGEAMEHLEIAIDDRHHDAWINRNIKTAREYCEGWLGRSLAPQTLELSFGAQAAPTYIPSAWQTFQINPWTTNDNVIALPFGPVSSIVSVTYVDEAGVTQTMPAEDYALDTWSDPSGVHLVFEGAWPTPQASRNAIQIRYLAGYTLPDDSPSPNPLPQSYVSAMLLVLGSLFRNRENDTDLKLDSVLLGAHALMEMQGRSRLGMA